MKTQSFKYLLILAVLFATACGSKESATETEEPVEEVAEVAPASDKEIGIQIYSVRDALKEDFEGTVNKVAEIGYDYIEAYGLGTDGQIFGMSPAEYKKVVSDAGMEIHSVHSTFFGPDDASTVLEAAKTLGVKYVVVPWMNEDLRADYAAAAQTLNEAGKAFAGSGIKLAYHNHEFEFEEVDGKYALEVMMENSEPENLMFQVDLYWVKKGGADPVGFVSKHAERVCSYHIKDAVEGSLDQTTVGTGVVDFAGVFGIDESKAEFYFVEDEREDDPLANVAAAYSYLQEADFTE